MGDRVTVGKPISFPTLILQRGGCARTRAVPGFSLIDVMVSMAVIAILIALLIPSMKGVRDLADRVVCASNVRQNAMGLQMHADEREGEIPESVSFNAVTQRIIAPEDIMAARRLDAPHSWDGLGWLYRREFLAVPDIYYCPAHSGEHPIDRYRNAWRSPTLSSSVVINYQYRGAGPTSSRTPRLTTRLWGIHPGAALVTDGMRTQADFNHVAGANVLRADLSVSWFPDETGALKTQLPKEETESDSSEKIQEAWAELDSRVPPPVRDTHRSSTR